MKKKETKNLKPLTFRETVKYIKHKNNNIITSNH